MVETAKKPKKVSVGKLSLALMAYRNYVESRLCEAEMPLRKRVNVKLLMGLRDFRIKYVDFMGTNKIGIILSKKVYDYYPIESMGRREFEDHIIWYDLDTGEYSCDEDDKISMTIIKKDRKQLDIISSKISKYRPLNDSISYETFRKGMISIPINGNVYYETDADYIEAHRIYVPVDELPKSIKRAYVRGKRIVGNDNR